MYASVANMVARFGELEVIQVSDRDRTGDIDHAVVNVALSDASLEIDGYLSRYNPPISPTPPVLVRVACEIAHYRLLGINNTLLTDEIIKRYDRNILWLKDVKSGKAALNGVVNDNDGKDDSGDAVQFNSGTRVFSRD